MEITLKDHLDAWAVHKHIYIEINDLSRFKANVEAVSDKRIKVSKIRLKESKPYCGSHPFVCDIEGGRKANFLEGADWVEFNDRLNDVLDRLNAVAYVRSMICIVRKGGKRRVRYDGTWEVFNGKQWILLPEGDDPSLYAHQHPVWKRDEDDKYYRDWRLKIAPNSWYPPGTPGSYKRVPYYIVPNEEGWERRHATVDS